MEGYKAGLVLKVVGISYARLDYWARIGFIKPSIKEAKGGSNRLYSFTDLVRLKTAKNLLDNGISLQKIRKAINYLKKHEPEIKEPLSELKFLTNGKSIFTLTKDSEKVIDVLNRSQFVWSIAIGKISQSTKSKVKKTERVTEKERKDGGS
ncbi:MerR family transcriptional regulator [Candidatus Aerophobetes bacterium]|nr:MerR family transcriptional regulator [Candidatus Aerophobetes bacterium]